jgi:hypothetical protein
MSDSPQMQPADALAFLVFQASSKAIVSLGVGRAPEAAVRVELAGKWNRGAEDAPVLVMTPKLAREWATHLAEVADAAERDLETYLSKDGP